MAPRRGSLHLPGGPRAWVGRAQSAQGQSWWPAPGNAAAGATHGWGAGRSPPTGQAAESARDTLSGCPGRPPATSLMATGACLPPCAHRPARDGFLGTDSQKQGVGPLRGDGPQRLTKACSTVSATDCHTTTRKDHDNFVASWRNVCSDTSANACCPQECLSHTRVCTRHRHGNSDHTPTGESPGLGQENGATAETGTGRVRHPSPWDASQNRC